MKCIISSKDASLYQIITESVLFLPRRLSVFPVTVRLLTVVPREIENNAFCKLLEGKQRVLCFFEKGLFAFNKFCLSKFPY